MGCILDHSGAVNSGEHLILETGTPQWYRFEELDCLLLRGPMIGGHMVCRSYYVCYVLKFLSFFRKCESLLIFALQVLHTLEVLLDENMEGVKIYL